jgi:xanthine dehydrogenase accessory factor
MELFMEKISGKRALIIGGAGHVGLCLYRIALELEYRVIIIDPRPELNSEERFPKAERLIREFKDGVEGVTVNPGDAVVLVGPGHVSDREMLPSVLKSPAGYIGMIGSKRKQQEVYKHLQNEQNFTDADFQRIYSPVGLDIGSESPAEIAVSIMAEMIRHYKTTQNN